MSEKKLTPEFYAEKARNELNETEARKDQSLKQFREWIAKHPFILSNNFGDQVFLAYLRAKKYSMDRAFEAFEKIVVGISQQLEFHSSSKRALEFIETGYLVLPKRRDENGCRTLIMNIGRFDTKRFTLDDLMTSTLMATFILMMDPEVQISGVNVVINFKDFTTEQMSTILSHKIVNGMTHVNFNPLRYKKFVCVGLPTFGDVLLNFVKNFLSEKLKNRFLVCKNFDFEVGIDEVEDMSAKFHEIEDIFDYFRNVKIDLEEFKKYTEFEAVGSFRKLEVD